jgi:hypothetical protein
VESLIAAGSPGAWSGSLTIGDQTITVVNGLIAAVTSLS